MADETTITNPALEQDDTTQVQAPVSNPFDDESWSTTPVKADANVPQETLNATEAKAEDEEILDPKEWLKREFNTDDLAVLKAEREEYKKLKAEPSREFANEQSKTLHELIRQGKNPEVREFLEKQEKLENLVSSDVTDDTAGDILKMQLRLKYDKLTDKQIDYKFNQMYGIPSEPVQDVINETDDEFDARKAAWQEKVDDIKMNRSIEAEIAKPELAKLKAELVLPDITKGNQNPEATQEELAAFNKERDSFLQNAEKSINGFTGFSVQVKDKDVDYAVSYTPSQEEKTFVDSKLKTFAESGFDANSLLAERWVEPDGKTIKVEQMVKDLSLIYSNEKVSQKLVTDAVNKRMEAFLKDKKQIDVSGKNPAGTFDPSNAQTEMDKVRDNAFA